MNKLSSIPQPYQHKAKHPSLSLNHNGPSRSRPEPEAEEEDQVLLKMSPTMEEVGPEEMPGQVAG